MNNENDSNCKVQRLDNSTVLINQSFNNLEQQQQIELEDGEVCEESSENDDNGISEKDKSGLLKEATTGLTKSKHNKQYQKHNEGNVVVDNNINQNDELQQKIERRRQRDFMKEDSPDLSGIKDLFVLESRPSEEGKDLPTPSYKRSFKDALRNENSDGEHLKNGVVQSYKGNSCRSCFNCGERNHTVRECPEPRENHRIRRATNAFKKTKRYHTNMNEKFSSIEPGKISHKLKKALGLKKGELPFFFYRMRVLGYPPGWLEDAKIEKSNLTIYDSDGNKILASDEEEGEIYELTTKYDAKKIIDFPGFNQHPGDKFYDDYKYHKVPPFSARQSKEEFIKSLGDAVCNGHKRKKLRSFPTSTTTNKSDINMSLHEDEYMILESSDESLEEHVFIQPPLPSEEPPNYYKPCTPPPLPQMITASTPSKECEENVSCINLCEEKKKEEEKCSSIFSNSTSSIDLVPKQQHLFTELKKSSTVRSSSLSISHLNDSLINEILAVEEGNKQEQPTKVDNIKNVDSTNCIKGICLGTPIRKYTEYDTLPSRENFKEGMSDIIDFYNVPTSSGNFEEMKKVLKQVKKTMRDIQEGDAL